MQRPHLHHFILLLDGACQGISGLSKARTVLVKIFLGGCLHGATVFRQAVLQLSEYGTQALFDKVEFLYIVIRHTARIP